MGDLEITTGSTTGEVVGMAIYDHPSNKSIISGLTTVTIDGTGYQSALTISEVPVVTTGNAGTSNELSIACLLYTIQIMLQKVLLIYITQMLEQTQGHN